MLVVLGVVNMRQLLLKVIMNLIIRAFLALMFYSAGLSSLGVPDFGRSVNPISTGGTDYAQLITTGTPGFSDPPTALCIG